MDSLAPHALSKPKNARVFRREANDFYVEEPAASIALFAAERFGSFIWDPACGTGNVLRSAEAAGYKAWGTDIVDRSSGLWPTTVDFLAPTPKKPKNWRPSRVDSVVANPPFNLADMFVDRALEVAPLKVAVLNRLAWLEGGKRSEWFKQRPLARVWVFPWRLNMPPGGYDGPRKGGTIAFAWFVFEHGYRGRPQVDWLTKPAAGVAT